jgi:hypothetical protein
MNKHQAIEVLKAHNEWRRDKGDTKNLTMHEPKVIGEAIDVAIAALSDAVTPPDGWVAVPVEPTEQMLMAGLDAWSSSNVINQQTGIKKEYQAMLQAAPNCEKES